MEGDRNEADRILGEDWMMTGYRRFLEAWEKHPQRELLDERKGETDETGAARWGAVREVHEDGWVECWQRPTDLRDGRESIRIGAWPEKAETDELGDVQAIVAEHDGTPRWH